MSGVSNRETSPVSLSNTSSSIESCVTKLIISTKNLLQKLTAWTRGQETQRSISDAYVQLGNDFQVVVKQFMRAGIDMNDMRNVPKELRAILEKALKESPSNEALDKYWPSIKDIIETLLTKIKEKRQLLKHLEEQKRSNISESSNGSAKPSLRSPSPPKKINQQISELIKNKELPHEPEPQLSAKTTTQQQFKKRASSRILLSPEDFQQKPSEVETNVNVEPVEADNFHNSEYEDTEALTKLKKGANESLQRKASKRFSAYHIAKLTSNTTNPSLHPLPISQSLADEITYESQVVQSSENSNGKSAQSTLTIEENKKHLDENAQEKSNDVFKLPTTASNMEKTVSMGHKLITVFLKYEDQVKKSGTTFPILNRGVLNVLFAEKFSVKVGTEHQIYLKDPKYSHISYELEDRDIENINDGFVIELKMVVSSEIEKLETKEITGSVVNNPDTDASSLKLLEERLLANNTEMLKQFQLLLKDSISSKSPQETSIAPLDFSAQSPVAVRVDNDKKRKLIEDLKTDVRVIKQLQAENKTKIENSVAIVASQLGKLDPSKLFAGEDNANSKRSEDRAYLETSQGKLSALSDDLLTNVDDLQDTIELLRKDVAIRGSQPKERQLEEVKKELDLAVKQLKEMEEFVKIEKPFWNKIWEQELEKVCEEQQFLNLQEDLCFDLSEDLKRCQETFDLVTLCSQEKSKKKNLAGKDSNGSSRDDLSTKVILPLAKPGTFNEVREAVLTNIAQLQPDHESRVEAIKKSEKLRLKEKELLLQDEFNQELGKFVETGQLNKSGGIEELERIRMMKDAENLKNMMMK